jgi:hypothetical protein
MTARISSNLDLMELSNCSLLEAIFADIYPELTAKEAGWHVFKEMVDYYISSDE